MARRWNLTASRVPDDPRIAGVGGRIRSTAAVTLFVLAGAAPAVVIAAPPAEDPNRHRLDFSYVAIDSRYYDSTIWTLGYAYSLTPKTNLSVAVPLLDPSLDNDHDSGIGDSTLSFSWTPRQEVSVRPWVPRQIGTGIGVTVPTGNVAKGRGLDAILLTPYLGAVVPLNDRISLLPALVYSHSMGSTALDTRVRFAAADLGIIYLRSSRWWVTVYGAYLYDFEVHDSYWNYATSIGLLITENWGGSVQYDHTQYFEPGVLAAPTGAVDSQLSLSLHYNF